MRNYEVVILVKPDTKEALKAIEDKYYSLITKDGGKVHRFENWGMRETAYPVKDLTKVNYYLFNIEISIELLNELKTTFYYDESVVRNLVIGRTKPITEKSKILELMEEENKDG